MKKQQHCKICGEDSGKRNVYLNCKTKYPYKVAASRSQTGSGGPPFIRRDKYLKDKQQEVRA